MKTKMFLFVAIIAMIMTSCGSSKKSQNDQMMMMMMQMMQQQQQYQGQQQQAQLLDPNTMESNITPCERLARQGWQAGKLRGYGSGVSGNRDMARNRATLSARNEIASQMRTWIRSFMKDYNEDIDVNEASSNEQKFSAIQESVVDEVLQGSVIIFDDVKKEGSNRYFYEVCVELDPKSVINAVLNESALNGVRLNAEKLTEKAEARWNENAVKKAGYDPAVANYQNEQQQQQLNMQQQQINMQQQQHNMNMEQQQMQMQQQQQQHNQNMQQQHMDMRQKQQQHDNNIEQQYMNLRY